MVDKPLTKSDGTLSNSKDVCDLDERTVETPAAEVDLVRRAQRGESSAFAELVRLYQRRAVSVSYRLLGNIEDAGDVSQDAFVRAYRGLAQLEDPSRFGPWLMRIVTNLALNYRRSRKLKSASSLDSVELISAEARNPASGRRLTASPGDAEGPLPEELHRAIDAALERLPEKQRLALILFSVEGMPQKEVAEILACSIELVKWNVFQARKKLRELLQEFL